MMDHLLASKTPLRVFGISLVILVFGPINPVWGMYGDEQEITGLSGGGWQVSPIPGNQPVVLSLPPASNNNTEDPSPLLRSDQSIHESIIISSESSEPEQRRLPSVGRVHYDPGFGNTAECESRITYIDGAAGILEYRGYPIEQLALESNFLETAYLLIYGELPKAEQLDAFIASISQAALLPGALKYVPFGFKAGSLPMPMLSSLILALGSHLADVDFDALIPVLLKHISTLGAMAYHRMMGSSMLEPSNLDSNYVGLFLQRLLGREFPDEVLTALDLIFLLHADHEQNCSTSTLRTIGSSKADVFAAVSGAIGALSGPLHGGANQEVIVMLEGLHQQVEEGASLETVVADFLGAVKKKERLLMGFGHRVYKNYDPRAKRLKEMLPSVLVALNAAENPLLKIAIQLESAALADEYFTARKLYPNVDFYSGLVFRALGIDPRFYPVLFAIGRMPGWLAHYREQLLNKQQRICRPQQIYRGPERRDYVPMSKRLESRIFASL